MYSSLGNIFGSKLSSRLSTVAAKRFLNRSVETPRIFKQLKESTTPITPKTIAAPDFSDDDVTEVNKTPHINKQPKNSNTPTTPKAVTAPNFSDDDDVIEVSSDEEVPIIVIPKTPVKKVPFDSPSTTSIATAGIKQEPEEPNIMVSFNILIKYEVIVIESRLFCDVSSTDVSGLER